MCCKIEGRNPVVVNYSHGDDVEQLHLSDVEQRMIAAKLTLEVPTKSIIKSVCDKMALDMKRIDLINKDDIRNIQDFHGIHAKDDCTHQDDSASVHFLCRTFYDEELLRLYNY
ncbi:hypothetical protein D910_11057 [Dendroctonus ponderosae]|uniref:Uncharacterized protein n=1 Tax=Dendroctonus ponderosae TaxID=77166 RepID=U4UUA2_DENPD|nr:hypothetical protein D910_11057 [Dendroctonus ponderosae]